MKVRSKFPKQTKIPTLNFIPMVTLDANNSTVRKVRVKNITGYQ